MTPIPVPPEERLLVLREMVRLAERRRDEVFEMMERVNKYNLALIAFSGSFLSLLVSTNVPIEIVRIAGIPLIVSIVFSLIAIAPRVLKGGTLLIEDDVESFRRRTPPSLESFLLNAADLTEKAATKANKRTHEKKQKTVISVFFLAIALTTTYILYTYA